jgi:hypothetical protein
MDANDLRWLLQTIETPEMTERFVLAQYKQGRISAHVIAEVGHERPWISQVGIKVRPAATHQCSEYAATETFIYSQQTHPHGSPIFSTFCQDLT